MATHRRKRRAGTSDHCDPGLWFAATYNNSNSRRAIVVDAWPHTGIGHSIRHAALWLRLVQTHGGRSLRFAFSCIPPRLQSEFREPEHEVPPCDRVVYDPITRTNVTAVPFDPLQHLSFHGLSNLQATRRDFTGLHRRPPEIRSCADLHQRLQSKKPVVVFYGLKLRELLESCVQRLLPKGPALACLRHVHLRTPRPLPTCDVGLHLRSMRLDDKHCDLLSGMPTVNPRDGGQCQFTWRGRRCQNESLSQVVAGCQGQRFATADSPHLYPFTRYVGWQDLDETASVTWNERAITPYPVQLGDVAATAAAFVALTKCRRAIVAPVVSHFSETAALAAGVPLFGCCSQVA